MSTVLKAKSEDLFAMMDNLFANGSTLWIVVSGMSMYPFLREDLDKVELTRADFSKIKKGDIVLIKRANGEFVLHRVIKKTDSDFFIVGDAQQWIEGPVLENQLKATVINISRKNKVVSCNNFILKSLVRLWMLIIPIRYKLIKVFRILSRLARHHGQKTE